MIDDDALGEYLNDHLSGAVGAIDLLERHLEKEPDAELEAVLGEIREERSLLEALIGDLSLSTNVVKQAAAWAAEKGSRLLRDIERMRNSDLADLLELEVLQIGIFGKRSLWVMLKDIEDAHPQIAARPLDTLIEQADRQIETVQAKRVAAGRVAFTT